jgi:hypothetical protein
MARIADSSLLARYDDDDVPRSRRNRERGWLDNWDKRNREREDDYDAYDKLRRQWYERERDPRWKPPTDVPAPWDRDHEIGGRRRRTP